MLRNRHLRRSVALGGVALGALTLAVGSAWSQQAPANPKPQSAPDQIVAAPPPEENPDERVFITGSRIAKDEYTSASPITVITAEVAASQGVVDAADVLQNNTVANGSTQINGQLGAFLVEGGPGVRTIALRGLGSQRTLVLLNGRRLGGAGTTGTTGAVDLSVIPESIVQRYEILKDGASSIYGSDAVAGVVNIITRPSVPRAELNLELNDPFDTGRTSYGLNGAFGLNFDRGSITLAASWRHREELDLGERSWSACGADYYFDPTTGDRADITTLRPDEPPGYKCRSGGLSNAIQVLGSPVGGNGSNILYVTGTPTTGPFPGMRPRSVVANGNADLDQYDPLYLKSDLLDGSDVYSLFGTADFDLGPVDLYSQLLMTRRESTVDQGLNFAAQVDQDNPFNPFPSAAGTTGEARAFIPREFNATAEVNYVSAVAGLRGKFGFGNWSWDAFASYSRSDGRYAREVIDARNLESTINPFTDVRSFTNGAGQIVCARISNPAISCPAINYLSPRVLAGALTPEEHDFLFNWDKGKTVYDQTLVSATFTGDVLRLPAGPLALAVGGEYRQISLDDRPGPISQGGFAYNTTTAVTTKGKDKIAEVYAEADIPILKGLPFIEELTASLSGRWFDYDSAGSDSVYKIGLNWQVTPMIRFRGTAGTSYRAPALYELYLGNAVGFQPQTSIDPCINYGQSTNPDLQRNCAALGIPDNYTGNGNSANVIVGGGAGVLTPETSEAKTLGVIFTPTWLDLSVVVDYFDIRVVDEITRFGASSITRACYGSPSFPNGYCNLLTRVASGPDRFRISEIRDSYLNINRQSNRGIDVNLRYNHEFNFGNLTGEFQGTWTFEDKTQLFNAASAAFDTNDYNGSISEPDFTAQTRLSLQRHDLTWSWYMTGISRSSDDELFGNAPLLAFTNNTGPTTVRLKRYAEATIYHDVSVRYRTDDWTLIVGINNLFDEAPPAVSMSSVTPRVGVAPVFGTQYDLLGRRYFVQVQRKF